MSFADFLSSIVSTCGQAAAPGSSGFEDSDMSIVSHISIARLMHELVDNHRPLAVYKLDGAYLGSATLISACENEVFLRLYGNVNRPLGGGRKVFNIWASTTQGFVMFTLVGSESDLPDLYAASLPREVIRVQSRRHRRVVAPCGLRHWARLQGTGLLQEATLVDLSEEGVGLQVPAPVQSVSLQDLSGQLIIDGDPISVPVVHVVHCTRVRDSTWHVGASLHGIAPEAQRHLRRWLDAVETSSSLMVERA